MIIVLKAHATENDAKHILSQIEAAGLKPLYMPGVERIVLGALGDERVLQKLHIEGNPLVEEVKPILTKYKMVSRDVQAHNSVVRIGNVAVGGDKFVVMAGPCSVESEQQLMSVSEVVKSHGATVIRGGAFKPRTSPYDFQGMGIDGLKLLKQASDMTGMPTVSEVMEVGQVDAVCQYIDCLQIGARNMQNYGLLKAVGETGKPVLLKRGLSATIEELLLAAEYIYDAGNPNIILCERGIRTYETATRNTLDLNAVAYIKQRSHLPVIVDPSHGTGVRELVTPLSRAAVAVGADGVIVESHLNPSEALSDGHQALTGEMFAQLMQELKPFVEAAGRAL